MIYLLNKGGYSTYFIYKLIKIRDNYYWENVYYITEHYLYPSNKRHIHRLKKYTPLYYNEDPNFINRKNVRIASNEYGLIPFDEKDLLNPYVFPDN